jgi:hypothetical protein
MASMPLFVVMEADIVGVACENFYGCYPEHRHIDVVGWKGRMEGGVDCASSVRLWRGDVKMLGMVPI